MWKNVTIGVLSVSLIFLFMLYWAARKLAIDTSNELAAKMGTTSAVAAAAAVTMPTR